MSPKPSRSTVKKKAAPKPDDVKKLRKQFLGYFKAHRKKMTAAGWAEVGNIFDTTIGNYIAVRQGRNIIVWNRTSKKGVLFRKFITSAARSVARQVARVRPRITKPEVIAAALYVFKRFKKHCDADRYGEPTGMLGTVCDTYIDAV